MDHELSLKNHILMPVVLVLLASITFLIYSNTLKYPFFFDDTSYITEDEAIRMESLSWEAIKTAALKGRPRNRLIPNISFALNHLISRYHVLSYHLTNIAIHIATGLILFFLLRLTLVRFERLGGSRRWTESSWIAAFAALLWLVHPVNTQAATYIVQRMTSLAAFFYTLSLFLYVCARGRWQDNGKITPAAGFSIFGCILAGICAVISKQNAAMLPIIIVLYEWFFFQNLSVSLSKKHLVWLIGALFVFSAIALLYLGGDPLERILSPYAARRDFTLFERVITEWRVVIYYLTLLFYPHPARLMLDHDYPLSVSMLQPETSIFALFALFSLIGLAMYIARRQRFMAFCLIWFLLNLVIESSIIGIEIIYEHRTYLPFMLLIAAGVYLALRHSRYLKTDLAVTCLIILLFSIWSHQRSTCWESGIRFWTDNVRKAPNDFRPHANLGEAFHNTDQIDRAIDQYRSTLALKPGHSGTLNNLATALIQQGRYEKALEHLRRILKHTPNAEAHVNAGAALAHMKHFDEAIAQFKKALAIHPEIAETHNNIGVLWIKKGDLQAARKHFQKALSLRPGYVSAKQNLEKLQKMMASDATTRDS